MIYFYFIFFCRIARIGRAGAGKGAQGRGRGAAGRGAPTALNQRVSLLCLHDRPAPPPRRKSPKSRFLSWKSCAWWGTGPEPGVWGPPEPQCRAAKPLHGHGAALGAAQEGRGDAERGGPGAAPTPLGWEAPCPPPPFPFSPPFFFLPPSSSSAPGGTATPRRGPGTPRAGAGGEAEGGGRV